MNTDKNVVSSPRKVVEGIQEVFEAIAHMLDGVIGQLEELENQDAPETGGGMPYAFDGAVEGAPPADTSGKKPAAKRQRKTPEKKAKAVKEAEGTAAIGRTEEAAAPAAENTAMEEMDAGLTDTEKADTETAESAASDSSDTPPWEPPKDTGQATAALKPAAPKPAPVSRTITKDDITSVIVAKIKQNRSNNEKIGKLLSAYGVKALSDLPEGKYEAFLADISQI